MIARKRRHFLWLSEIHTQHNALFITPRTTATTAHSASASQTPSRSVAVILHMVHFDPPARSTSPHEQPVRPRRFPPVHAYFNGNHWDDFRGVAPTSTASEGPEPSEMNSAAAPDHARPLPVHPPGVVPNRPLQRLPPSAASAPYFPHDFPLAHRFIDAFPPYRPPLDPSHARGHPVPISQQPPPWYIPHMQYFPPPPPATAPPAPVHKVWILDCKSCGTFLTNRGMKVST